MKERNSYFLLCIASTNAIFFYFLGLCLCLKTCYSHCRLPNFNYLQLTQCYPEQNGPPVVIMDTCVANTLLGNKKGSQMEWVQKEEGEWLRISLVC